MPAPVKLSLPFGDSSLPQALSTGDEAASPVPGLQDGGRLWLCLYCPHLPLEVSTGCRVDVPFAVMAEEKKKPVILSCDDAAARGGVKPGMPVNAALALVPDLELRLRRHEDESDRLDELAAWAQRFTPRVSPDPCGALLLEIGTSLPLFGGADALRAAAVAGIRERGHVVRSAVAPAARAALWLARCGQEAMVTGFARLPGVLARLPLAASGWPQAVQHSLRRMGVSQLGECMRLPRDGLARRIGKSCVHELDEALGRRPELRPARGEDTRFRGELELPAETRETAFLMAALRILLNRLETHLQARQGGVQILWLGLRHRRAPPTVLRIGLLRPSANARHLEELAALHLAEVGVPAPVIAITLEADAGDVPPALGKDLLGRDRGQEERMAGLVERLRLRLGLQAVHGIRIGREHRPEHAWQTVQEPVARRTREDELAARAQRPLWMLEHPAPLRVRAGDPLLDGPLTLERGPERIETGWWDGGDIRRDYYVASGAEGTRVWVFNDRRSGGWYLHGLFG